MKTFTPLQALTSDGALFGASSSGRMYLDASEGTREAVTASLVLSGEHPLPMTSDRIWENWVASLAAVEGEKFALPETAKPFKKAGFGPHLKDAALRHGARQASRMWREECAYEEGRSLGTLFGLRLIEAAKGIEDAADDLRHLWHLPEGHDYIQTHVSAVGIECGYRGLYHEPTAFAMVSSEYEPYNEQKTLKVHIFVPRLAALRVRHYRPTAAFDGYLVVDAPSPDRLCVLKERVVDDYPVFSPEWVHRAGTCPDDEKRSGLIWEGELSRVS